MMLWIYKVTYVVYIRQRGIKMSETCTLLEETETLALETGDKMITENYPDAIIQSHSVKEIVENIWGERETEDNE